MKIKILILLMIAGLSASAQFTNFNPYGVQKANSGDSLRLVGSASGQYLNLPTTKMLRNSFSQLPLKGKTVLIMGTSIEEGTGAIEAAVSKNGGESINIAIGSSISRKAKKDGGYSGLPWEFVLKAFSATVAEKNTIISNWNTIRDSLIGNPPLLVPGDYETIRNYSYERKLLPYLNGTLPMPDYFYMGHGYNDGQFLIFDTNESYLDFVSQPTDSVNRNYFLGAENFIIRLIKQYNPNAIIIKGEHYENQKQQYIVQAQREVARKWEIPLFSISESTGWTNNRIANTQSLWNTTRYLPYKSAAGADTLLNMTELRLALPDGVHPYSDLTGKAKQKLTDVYDYQIKGLFKKGYYVPSLQEVLTQNNVSNRDIRLRGNLFIDKYKQFIFTNDEGTGKWAFNNVFDLSEQDKLIVNTGVSTPLIWHQNGNAEWQGLHSYQTISANNIDVLNQFLVKNNKQILFTDNIGGIKFGLANNTSNQISLDSDLGNILKIERNGFVSINSLSGPSDRPVFAGSNGTLKIGDLSGFQTVSNLSSDLTSSSIKYPSVNAVNTGLASKLNTNNPTATGTLTTTGELRIGGDIIATNSGSIYRYQHRPDTLIIGGFLGGENFDALKITGGTGGKHFKSLIAPTQSDDIVRLGDISGKANTNGGNTFSGVQILINGSVQPLSGFSDSGFINTLQSNQLTTNVNTYLPQDGGQLVNSSYVGKKQVLTASGNGSATTISIAHNMTGITSSSWVSAIANNSASAGIQYVTVDATNVNIFYTVAPVSGTNNLLYSIEVKQ